MNISSEHVLVIDDDSELCNLLSEYLKQENFTVDCAHYGERGIEMVLERSYSMVILDVMLPGTISGFNVLQQIRTRTAVPVLMLSARGEEVDRIVGLEMGADDYLPKPFNPRELLARIRTILRRSKSGAGGIHAGENAINYQLGDLELNTGTRSVCCADKPVELTSVEYNLLEMLLKSAGQVLTRDELTAHVLGRPLSPYDRSIDVHISKIRKKLGPHRSGIERIKSVRGAGYVYTIPMPDGNHGINGNQ
jgi:two-component system, OmpR family, response regulator CpxR